MTKAKTFLTAAAAFGVVFAGVTAALKFNEWTQSQSSVFKRSGLNKDLFQNVSLDQVGNSPDFRLAAKRILPSVVSIDTQVEGETFFGERYVRDYSSGSGVVVSQDGYIVTNNHVVRANLGFGRTQVLDKVRVTLSDGSTVPAQVVGTDPRADLAVLKVAKSGLTPISVGDSRKVEVGQWVVAVGNPLGFENTLSVGVVSNVNRQLPGTGDAVFIDGIQTDAAINHGNSGGALCNADGELVGICSSIATTTNANIGIGFAIPANRMKQVVDDIIKFGYAKYGQSGIQVWNTAGGLGIAEAREEIKRRTSSPVEPPKEGAVVVEIEPNSVAAQAGVHTLDVVTEVNGNKVADFEDFRKFLSPLRPGTQVELKVWSAGKEKLVKLTLTDAGKGDA